MHDAGMNFLQLNPSVQAIWSTPTTLRFGVDQEIVTIENPAPRVERLIAALKNGMPVNRFDGVAQALGVQRGERDQLLAQLDPVLRRTESSDERAGARVALIGEHSLVSPLAETLARSGHQRVDASDPEIAVLAAHFVLPLSRSRAWLTRGIPHLPIIFSETVIRVGPLVKPHGNPCCYCVERSRTDSEPAWPAIASQCLGRRSMLATPGLTLHTSAIALNVLTRWQEGDQRVHDTMLTLRPHPIIGAEVSTTLVTSHSACDCSLNDGGTELADEG